MNIINIIFTLLLFIGTGLFAYVSTVIVHEQRTGKRIPLIWEKRD